MGRGVEYDGDVVILHLVDEAQQQRLALLGRELVEQRLDRLADAQHVLRFDHRVERGQRHPQSRLPVRKVAFVHPRTVQVDQAVVNDPEKVGLDVDDAAQVDLAGHNVEEYVVDDILDRFVVETEPHAVGIERIGVTVIQHNIYVGLFGILPVDSSGVVLALPKHSVHWFGRSFDITENRPVCPPASGKNRIKNAK